MPKNVRFGIGAGLIVVAIAYLIVTAVRNTAEYYLTVNEVKVRETELSGQMLRVAGRVQPASIGWDPTTLTLQFAITQPPPGDGEPIVKTAMGTAAPDGTSFRVISRGQPKPDMFAAGRDVIVEGRIGADHTIEARQVLTSCPSKYAPKQRK